MKWYLAEVRLKLNLLRNWNRGMKFENTGHDTDIHVMWNILSDKMKTMKLMNETNHHDRNMTIVNGVSMVIPNSKFDLPTAAKAGEKS